MVRFSWLLLLFLGFSGLGYADAPLQKDTTKQEVVKPTETGTEAATPPTGMTEADRLGKQIDVLSTQVTWGFGLLAVVVAILTGLLVFMTIKDQIQSRKIEERADRLEEKTDRKIDRAEKDLDRAKDDLKSALVSINNKKENLDKIHQDAKNVMVDLSRIRNAFSDQKNNFQEQIQAVLLEGKKIPQQLQEQYEAALKLNQALKENKVGKTAKDYYDEAFEYFIQEKWLDALPLITLAIELNENNVEYWLLKGRVFRKLKKYTLAIEAFNKAKKYNPDYDWIYIEIGDTHFFERNYQDAINSYEEALKLNNNNEWAWINLGKTHLQLGNIEKAIDYLDTSRDYFPTNSWGWYYYGLCLMKINSYEIAYDVFETSLRLNPTSAEANCKKAFILFTLYKSNDVYLKDALEIINTAIYYNADYKEAYETKAEILEALNRPQEAEASRRIAAELKAKEDEHIAAELKALEESGTI
jgi:tetratricopeptide (TPR) repeat protein